MTEHRIIKPPPQSSLGLFLSLPLQRNPHPFPQSLSLLSHCPPQPPAIYSLFWTIPRSGIIQYVVFCDWLLSAFLFFFASLSFFMVFPTKVSPFSLRTIRYVWRYSCQISHQGWRWMEGGRFFRGRQPWPFTFIHEVSLQEIQATCEGIFGRWQQGAECQNGTGHRWMASAWTGG